MNEETKATLKKVREMWESDPLTMTFCAAMGIGMLTALINALSAAQGRRAYAKQVKHLTRRKN